MPLDWTEPVSGPYYNDLRHGINCLIGCVAVIEAAAESADGNVVAAEYEAHCEDIIKHFTESDQRVRGNRKPGSPITKGDVKRAVINNLRILADRLDALE